MVTPNRLFDFTKALLSGQLEINKMSQMRKAADCIPTDEIERVMHTSITFENGLLLMTSDPLPSAGHELKIGSNFYISLHPESRSEAERIFITLGTNKQIEIPLEDTFWGAYFASFRN